MMKKLRCKITYEGIEYGNRRGLVNLRMRKNSILTIEGRCSGVRVSCRPGRLWITQEKDPRDNLIAEGGRFTLDRSGLAIVYSFSDSHVELERI